MDNVRGLLTARRLRKRGRECYQASGRTRTSSDSAPLVQLDDARRLSTETPQLLGLRRRRDVGLERTHHPLVSQSSLSSSDEEMYFSMHRYLLASPRAYGRRTSGRAVRGLWHRIPFVRRSEPEFYSDQMTYEDIIALEEWIGSVPIGLPDNVLKRMKTKKAVSRDEDSCPICLMSYLDGDTIRELKCGHEYHKHCVDVWFKERKYCPVCKADAA